MERYYQVLVKAPININPSDKVYRFMPGESHALPEHLGKEIFKPGSAYLEYFSLIDIQPPLDVVIKEPSLNELLKASSEPALNTLSTVAPVAPTVVESVKEEAPTLTDVLNTLAETKAEVSTKETSAKKTK